MNPKTALDLIKEKLKEVYDKEGKLPLAYTLHLIEQAKLIEKQQIIKAWEYGFNDGWTTRENDYNKNYHKKGTGQGYYDYEFNYQYGKIKEK